MVNPNQKNWIDKVDMVEFAINSSILETTDYAPFRLSYGYMPSIIKEIRSDKAIAQGIKAFTLTALQKEEPKISNGDLVYLSTKNLNLSKGRAHKLCPNLLDLIRL